MPQETASVESSKVAKPINIDWQRGGLRWKISTTFGGLILVLGLLVIGIVYYFTSEALQKQVDLRSSAIATNLADASAGLVSRKSALELDALVAKYGRLDGVAYAFIQDPKGEVISRYTQWDATAGTLKPSIVLVDPYTVLITMFKISSPGTTEPGEPVDKIITQLFDILANLRNDG